MLTTINDPGFIREVEEAVAQYAKEVSDIEYVEHGSENVVALVNKQFVFRFPRSERKARRIAYETALLQRAKGRITAVQIPELVEVHTRPLYLVAKYIPGEHLGAEDIKDLDESDQQAIGRTVAEFIHQFNQAISGLEVRRLRVESAVELLEEPWVAYFQRVFEHNRLPNEKLKPIINQYYSLWKEYARQEHNNYAIHDDLHPSNLLFHNGKLVGIVDFGDVNAGSIESELRWLYLMGDIVLRSAVDHYQQLSGNAVAYDNIRVWAIMHELSTFTDRLARQQTNAYPFQRAHQHLRSWISGFPL